ncbi:MAG TPA: urate hydroxylase PuuD [Oscillatoriaceae cyanobacterium]
MDIRELLDLLLRWTHVIAGIMWIGNSMLYNWLDRNLYRPDDAPKNLVGKIWMVHSGGFYEVEKKYLEPSQMPDVLHWFKWQSYTTWISGFLLLCIVYFFSGGAYLVDPSVSSIGVPQAIALCVGTLFLGYGVYDLLWRSPLRQAPKAAALVSFALLVGVVYGLTHVLAGRAAYLMVGALLGTLMSGNVFMHIMPSQRELVAATKAGREQDPAIGMRAKQRSIHNNYMTFPVIVIMLSNHFAFTYGNPNNWLILLVLILGGAGVRHFMNIRWTFKAWLPALGATAAAAIALLFVLTQRPPAPQTAAVDAHVSFAEAHAVIEKRCISCHSQSPTDSTFTVAPEDVKFDTPDEMQRLASKIQARAVDTTAMPLGNKTGMTPAERALLGQWIKEGAPTN